MQGAGKPSIGGPGPLGIHRCPSLFYYGGNNDGGPGMGEKAVKWGVIATTVLCSSSHHVFRAAAPLAVRQSHVMDDLQLWRTTWRHNVNNAQCIHSPDSRRFS